MQRKRDGIGTVGLSKDIVLGFWERFRVCNVRLSKDMGPAGAMIILHCELEI
jgi:hypothetical protein